MSYNGWSNYETWLVNVWVDSWCELREICHPRNGTGYDRFLMLRDLIQDIVLDDDPEYLTGLGKDLLRSALDNVAGRELVLHYETKDDDTEQGDKK